MILTSLSLETRRRRRRRRRRRKSFSAVQGASVTVILRSPPLPRRPRQQGPKLRLINPRESQGRQEEGLLELGARKMEEEEGKEAVSNWKTQKQGEGKRLPHLATTAPHLTPHPLLHSPPLSQSHRHQSTPSQPLPAPELPAWE